MSASSDSSSTPTDTTIVRARIHPGIGIARIGDSAEAFYIGPEVTTPPPTKTGAMRDDEGAIKRQAARFRVYGYNAAGEVVRELTADEADIEWTVHLANRKAEWYRFVTAMDIPEATPVIRRNKDAVDRDRLVIDPGPRSIQGKDVAPASGEAGAPYRFDTGTFKDVSVPLGELRTDDAGRLLVLGGTGVSDSPSDAPLFKPTDPSSFNNANDWYDDTSDGSVDATVTLRDGTTLQADSAWVAVAPPNYAPDTVAWRTLYDLLHDLYVEQGYVEDGWLEMPSEVSFTKHILPILERLSQLQWVNAGFAAFFGVDGPMNFGDASLLKKLATAPTTVDGKTLDPYHELRRTVMNAFRPSDTDNADKRTWPWIYGDAFGTGDHASPRQNLTLSSVRETLLTKWVNGEFVDDYDPDRSSPSSLSDVPLAEQPAMLDEANLHFCLADAFHPGCELTWPMRHITMYRAPFRIKTLPAGVPPRDYGATLTPAQAVSETGPLHRQQPGDLTRWMALPWQGDTAFCRSGYDPAYDPYIPTFWPGSVPNQVLTDDDYDIVMDDSRTHEERLAAFNNREGWLRRLTGTTNHAMHEMVKIFGEMGIVEARPGPQDVPGLPSVLYVESLPADAKEHVQKLVQKRVQQGVYAAKGKPKTALQKGGWHSEEQLVSFRETWKGSRRS